MSGQSEKIEWYYISDTDYQRLVTTGAWGTSANPFEQTDFDETFPGLHDINKCFV